METWLLLAALAGGRAAVLSLCVQAVGCGLTGLAVQFSDESALEVCNTRYALYRSTFLPFLTLLRNKDVWDEGGQSSRWLGHTMLILTHRVAHYTRTTSYWQLIQMVCQLLMTDSSVAAELSHLKEMLSRSHKVFEGREVTRSFSTCKMMSRSHKVFEVPAQKHTHTHTN